MRQWLVGQTGGEKRKEACVSERATLLGPGPVFAMGNVGDRPGRNLCEGARVP